MSTLRTYLGDKLVAFGAGVEKPYQRPANYPSITEPTASEEKSVMLVRVHKPFGTGDSARNFLVVRFQSSTQASTTVTGTDGTSVTCPHNQNTEIVFNYNNATSYAVDVNSAASGTSYYIEDLGNTSQADWNTLAGTTGVTYAVGDSFEAAVAGSTLSNSTGTVSIYNFRHVVVTITGTNLTHATKGDGVSRLAFVEEVYVSMPNYSGNTDNSLNFFFNPNPKYFLAYAKTYSTFPTITDAADWFSGYEGLVEFNCPANFLPNCTIVRSFFSACRLLTKISTWDTSSVTDFRSTFNSCHSLEVFPDFDYSAATQMSSAFASMTKLRVAPNLSLPSLTDATSLFNGCKSLREVGDISVPSATTVRLMFCNCDSLAKVGAITATSCTSFQQTFINCQSLEAIKSISFLSSGTILFSNVYQNCRSLKVAHFPPSSVSYSGLQYVLNNTHSLDRIEPAGLTLNASSITNNQFLKFAFSGSILADMPDITFSTSTFTGDTDNDMFKNMRRLQEIPAYDLSAMTVILANNRLIEGAQSLRRIKATGIACTFRVRNSCLSADALDELMTNCATVSGKTMNISNNPGTADCDTTIATNKGWTVTT